MKEYRKSIPLNQDSQHWFVELGPIPSTPDWHSAIYYNNSYPFPSLEAARRFAFDARGRHWQRDIAIRFPDGSREEIPHV